MLETLKKAWHRTKAWGAGASAYVTALFNTAGTFTEASAAASSAYDRAYDRSIGASRPSLTGVLRQAVRGNFSDAASQAIEAVEQHMDHEPNVNIDQARQAARAREESQHARKDQAREHKQAERHDERAASRDATRTKHHLPKNSKGAKADQAIADTQHASRGVDTAKGGFVERLFGNGKKTQNTAQTRSK